MQIKRQDSIFDISDGTFKKNIEHNYFRPALSSFKLVNWVIQFSSLKGTDKLVAATVASYYGYYRKYCFPTYENLIDATGLSHGTIAKGIKSMKLSGEWVIVRKGLTLTRRSNNCYTPLAPKLNDKRDKYGNWISSYKFDDIKQYNLFIRKIEKDTKWMRG